MHHVNSSLSTSLIPNLAESEGGKIVAFTESGICVYDEDAEDWMVYDMDNTNMPAIMPPMVFLTVRVGFGHFLVKQPLRKRVI